MANLKIYGAQNAQHYLSRRSGEIKFGERISFISSLEDLEESTAEFVLVGIPEDIGVRANFGRAGTSNAWEACLHSLLNVQHNQFFSPEKILLLGEIDCSPEMEKASNIDLSDPNYHNKLGKLVEIIDQAVSTVVRAIVIAGKIPVIVGGGHNNAFGNIKGTSEALEMPINVLNIDAHTDLRLLEHRHSGNGFSFARERAYLEKYAVFGLHENYTPEYVFDQFESSPDLEYWLLEQLLVNDKIPAFREALDFVRTRPFGLELDCDSIAGFPSSAQSPDGFSLSEVRKMVRSAAKNQNCSYLHVCEAVARDDVPTGKALSYLITDFLKARSL